MELRLPAQRRFIPHSVAIVVVAAGRDASLRRRRQWHRSRVQLQEVLRSSGRSVSDRLDQRLQSGGVLCADPAAQLLHFPDVGS